VWVKSSAFPGGFGAATIPYVHASPAKLSATLPVHPGPCPPPVGSCEGEQCGGGGTCVGEGCNGSSGSSSGGARGAPRRGGRGVGRRVGRGGDRGGMPAGRDVHRGRVRRGSVLRSAVMMGEAMCSTGAFIVMMGEPM